MLIDRPQVVEGSSIQNATVPSGYTFPSSPNIGELFYLIDGSAIPAALLAEAWEYQVIPYHTNPGFNNITLPTTGWQGSNTLTFDSSKVWLYPTPAGWSTPDASIIWARNTFTNIPAGLVLSYGADNGLVVWVNGVLVGSSNRINDSGVGFNGFDMVRYTVPATGTYEVYIKAFTEATGGENAGNVLHSEITGAPASVGKSGLYHYSGSVWEFVTTGTEFATHIADDTRHLTAAQNTLVDGITVTSAQLNTIPSLTTRLTTAEGTLSTHVADDTRHLTAAQNTLVDGITVTAATINTIPSVTTRVTTTEGNLATHIADDSRHLTASQNTLLDATTVTATDLNSIPSVTTRVTTTEGNLATHIADDARHLTAAQNTFLDGLNLPALTAAEVNFLDGTVANVQQQINAAVAQNNLQDTRMNDLETAQGANQTSIQTQLNTHIADDTRHLTAAQNTLLDGITVDFTQINKLTGLTSYLGANSLVTQLTALDNGKLNISGSNAMTGDLNMGSHRVMNMLPPIAPSDGATKDYVDSFVQGLHWVGSARVATIQDIVLSGLQTIDGIVLLSGNRVLVKNQTDTSQNGIWIAAAGAWSRASDFNTPVEVNNSAVFVLEGATQGKSTWIQLSTVAALNTDPLTWSAFSGPVINSAGAGISLGAGGMVSVIESYGITFDGNALAVDVHPSGGLMLTQNNSTASVAPAAQLALTSVGTAGTYRSVTTDAKGRVTAGTNPTTLAGYGITDGASLSGANFTGNISAPGMFAGALTGYTGFASNLVVNYAGNASTYGITLKPASTTSSTNAITFLTSTSTTAAPTAVGAIAQIAGDVGMNLSGLWYLNGQPITTSTNAVQKSGDTMTGNLTLTGITPIINLNSTTDNNQAIVTMSQNGSTRWRVGKLNSAETGTNVGSEFNIGRYTDGGVYIDSPFTITRNTGQVTIGAGGLRIASTGGVQWGTVGSVTTASSFMGFLRGGTATTAGYIGTDGGGILSGGTGTKFGIRSEADLILLAGSSLVSTLTTGGRMLLGTATDDGVNRLQVNGSISATSFSGAGTGLTGTAAGLTVGKANKLQFVNGSAGGANFNWSGLGGQPTWLWGGNASDEMYVYNPSNFSVAYATNAGAATTMPFSGLTAKPTKVSDHGITDIQIGNSSNAITGGGNGMTVNTISYITGVSIFGQTDGALYGQAYDAASYQHQIYGDYRTGSMAVRGRNNGTWGSWYTVWDSRSLPMSTTATANSGVLRDPNGYVFGTYINMSDEGVNGTAGTVTGIICKRGDQYYRNTTASSVKTFLAINGADISAPVADANLDLGTAKWMRWKNYASGHVIFDASASTSPVASAVNNTTAANPWTATFPTLMGWNGSTTYGVRVDTARLADTATVASNVTSISSATGLAYSWAAVQGFLSNKGSTSTVGASANYNLQTVSTDNGAAGISFLRNGIYAVNMGLDPDNVFRIGGWSAGANRLQLDMSGNLTAAGNVTAYSDERLKQNWQPLPINFVGHWADIKHGTFDRIDTGETQAGLSAQDVQRILPEAVTEMADGFLTVNYGAASAVATVALAKEVQLLKEQVKKQDALIKLLMDKIGY